MKRSAFLLFLLMPLFASAQTVTEKDSVYVTYPFSDPDPVPHGSHIYPYYKFEKFTATPEKKAWKTVILENDYVRVRILPEVGGKIWSIYDKKQGKELFYDNDAVKFRDISLRGPWTSGGIEFNFGVIGHAPSCSFPVDYKTVRRDGSVCCYIGVLDLLTRTRWTVEIELPDDSPRVKTRTFWHNASGQFQPYYTWVNTGVKATDDTRILYPAAYGIGHDGKTFAFPIEEGTGRDLSWLRNQKFGMDKSYHAGGSHKGFFSAWWENEDFGMMHYALRDDKVGRKYFSWAQSDAGDIWRELLTDQRPQYVELQSGRLFNQNLIDSYHTPYKQFLFTPFGTDVWEEWWFPYAGIGAADEVTLRTVASVTADGSAVTLGIYPLENLGGQLSLLDAEGGLLAAETVQLRAAEPWKKTFTLAAAPAQVLLDGRKVWSADSQEIARPRAVPADWSADSLEGKLGFAQYYTGMRYYDAALPLVQEVLDKDANRIEALDLKALLLYRKGDWTGAYDCSDKALAIDTYDPQANYLGGMAAWKLGRVYDALDRFEMASLQPQLRSAACTRLALLHQVLDEGELAAAYADKALAVNAYNLSALMVKYFATGDEASLDQIRQLDPLCHWPDFAAFLSGKLDAAALASTIQEEIRWQEYLESALFWLSAGDREGARKLMAASPEQNILLGIWQAYLSGDRDALSAALSQPMDQVFPFREESLDALEWAVKENADWRPRYLLSALYNFLGRSAEAFDLVKDLAPEGSADFYAFRSSLVYSEADLLKAVKLAPQEWRSLRQIAFGRLREANYKGAADILAPYWRGHKDNFYIGEVYAKALIADRQYAAAEKVMQDIRILPFEGQAASHVMYRDIKLHLAAAAIDRGAWSVARKKVAEARLWPHNLGVGRPYDDLVDAKAEDWLDAVILYRTGRKDEAARKLQALPEGAEGDRWRADFEKAVTPSGKTFPKVSEMLGNLDSTFDKRLF